MAVAAIPEPNGTDAYGSNGWLTLAMMNAVVKACNRLFKVVVDPNATTAKAEVTDNDVTLTLPPGGGGTTLPPYPSDDALYVLTVQSGTLAWVITTDCTT